MCLSSDGTFFSHWTTTNKSVIYQGKWKLQDGSMITTLTNCVAEGTTNFERVGTVHSFQIIQVDSTSLVYSYENQTISLSRK